MSKKSQWQKQCEKKLSLETLEDRHLLSAVPFTANTDLIESSAIYAPANDDAYVDFSALDETPVALEGDRGFGDEATEQLAVSAVGGNLTINFEAEANQDYTVVLVGYDCATDKETLTVKNVKPTVSSINDGVYSYSFAGKTNTSYNILVGPGKYTTAQCQEWFAEGDIPEEVYASLVLETGVYTYVTPQFEAVPGAATTESITFRQVPDTSNEFWEANYLEEMTFLAKFDGASTAEKYTVVDGEYLVSADGNSTYGIMMDYDYYTDEALVTVYGLKPHAKQTFQVAVGYSEEGVASFSDYSPTLTISTRMEEPVAVSAVGGNLTIDFEAEANLDYTVALVGYDFATQKDTLTVKNVKPTVSNINDGVYSYSFAGKTNTSYYILVGQGKYTTAQCQEWFVEGDIPEEVYATLVGETGIYTYATPVFEAVPGAATHESITFRQVPDTSNEFWEPNYLEEMRFLAKFDGAKTATEYTIDGDCLVSADGNSSYGIMMDYDAYTDEPVITIYGLAQNTKQSFQIAVGALEGEENSISAYSKSLTISTTNEQMPEPEDPTVFLNDNTTAIVEWYGDPAYTYTIAYSYTDAKGKSVTKTANSKAKVNEYGEGSFTVTKLQPGTKYTFTVSTNKAKINGVNYDASRSIYAENICNDFYEGWIGVLTPTVIPAPTLSKVSATDHSVTFQVTNWDKMEQALQEVDLETGEAGVFYITETSQFGGDQVAMFCYEGGWGADGWTFVDGLTEAAMEISTVNNKNVATVTISGLDFNTKYNFLATAYSDVQNYDINTVVPATSKALSMNTLKEQIAAPDYVGAYYDSEDSTVTVSWEAYTATEAYNESGLTYTVAYSYTDAKGKVVTKTVTNKAKTDDWGCGEVTVSKLQPGTKYTFSVCTNKTKDYEASEFTLADPFITPTVIPAPTLQKVSATEDSVTFQITNWDKMEAALEENDGYCGGAVRVSEVDEGDLGTFFYDTYTGWYWDGNYYAEMNIETVKGKDVATVTICELDPSTKYSFQVTGFSEIVNENICGVAEATSKALVIGTTMAAPVDVLVGFNCCNEVEVSWYGTEGATYTVAYSYTDAKGKVVTKTATNKATINENGYGFYSFSNLLSNTEYSFSVSANKTKDSDASVFVDAYNENNDSYSIVTPTTIPDPSLKQVSVTDTSATFQITNWDKMEAALQEGDWESGQLFVVETSVFDDTIAWFYYDPYGGWFSEDGVSEITIDTVKNQNVATITINGLEPSTNYNFQVEAVNYAQNDHFNGTNYATSKALKVKTAIPAHEPIEYVEAESTAYNSMDVTWYAEEGQQNVIITLTPTYGNGKTVTKTVNGKVGDNSTTITGLTANTEYEVSIVVKADKNGSQSQPAVTCATTLENFDLISVTKIDGENQFDLNFGVDMTQYSGRLDFVVSGSGKVYYDGKWYSDSIAATQCSFFFGDNAYELADEYMQTHPAANVIIADDDGVLCEMCVLGQKTQYEFYFCWSFMRDVMDSLLEFDFDSDFQYQVKGSIKLASGWIQNDETGDIFQATMGKTLNVEFAN